MTAAYVWSVTREAAAKWVADRSTRQAASIAFYAALSLAPLAVVVVAAAGAVYGDRAARGELVGRMRGWAGESGAEVVQTALANANRPGSGAAATLVTVALLLFGAAGVFSELQAALNKVWGVEDPSDPGIWRSVRSRLVPFGAVLAVAALLVAATALTTAAAAAGRRLDEFVPGLQAWAWAADVAVSLSVAAALFALLFKLLPETRVAWRHVWLGATVTAALFAAGKYLVGFYLGHAAAGSAYGAAGSLVALLVWVYYSASAFLFGAQVTAAHVRRSKAPPHDLILPFPRSV